MSNLRFALDASDELKGLPPEIPWPAYVSFMLGWNV